MDQSKILLENIHQFVENVKAKVLDDNQTYNVLKKLTNGMVTWPYLFNNQKVFRARIGRFEKLEDLWYPAINITKYGRMNTPICPVFYGSMKWNSPFYELCVKPGDIVSIIQIEFETIKLQGV